jgi:hypothetical protein
MCLQHELHPRANHASCSGWIIAYSELHLKIVFITFELSIFVSFIALFIFCRKIFSRKE